MSAGKEAMFGRVRGETQIVSGINAFIFSCYRSSERNIRVFGVRNNVGPGFQQVSQIKVIAYCR